MKKVLFILLILSFAAFATTPTVTVTEKEKSGVWAFSFSFTTSAIGTGDTAIVAPSAGYFTVDEWNRTDPVIYYLSTGETTVDSVRFDIVWQGKSYVSETNWHTLETVN